MNRFWYLKKGKVLLFLLQFLLAALITGCLLTISRYRSEDMSLRDMGRSFENTGLFYQTVTKLIREKVAQDQDRELFETNGSFDGQKQVDVRRYASGQRIAAEDRAETSYTVSDLISFGKKGAQELLSRMQELEESSFDDAQAGNAIVQEAAGLETIVPVSGVYLAETAQRDTGSVVSVLEYERSLCETALDVAWRYDRYQSALASGVSSFVPCNIFYYVENTADHHAYSNFGAASLLGAEEMVYEMEQAAFLFEGERRYNIMVSRPERVLNTYASDWFNSVSFLGSEEKILVAADLAYPVDDALQEAWRKYQQRIPYYIGAVAATAVSLLLLLILLFVSASLTGRNRKKGPCTLIRFDTVPTEIAAGLCLILGMIWWMASMRFVHSHGYNSLIRFFGRPAAVGTEYLIWLFLLMSMIRRYRSNTLWENSVVYYVLFGIRQVYSARKSSQRLLILYIGFVVLNMIFLLIGGTAGAVMALVLNLMALLYLMRDVVGNQNVREGLHQISEGKLDYRVNTKALTGESREMGEAVNEMGDGLQKAVDAMLKGERLKAELITNVSHDLKTPLTSVITYVDLLKKREIEDEKAQEYIQILDQKTQRLKTLTEDLIEASKISSGNVELHPVRLQLQQMILQAVGEFEDRLLERDIHMQTELEKEPVMIMADGASLWRVFENLLGNMAKYAKTGSPARITLTRENDLAAVMFSNLSQTRITASSEQLMQRFGRGDESRRTEGFGLGLSIADSLTKLMGGSFSIKVSEEEFQAVVCFPISADGAAEGENSKRSIKS